MDLPAPGTLTFAEVAAVAARASAGRRRAPIPLPHPAQSAEVEAYRLPRGGLMPPVLAVADVPHGPWSAIAAAGEPDEVEAQLRELAMTADAADPPRYRLLTPKPWKQRTRPLMVMADLEHPRRADDLRAVVEAARVALTAAAHADQLAALADSGRVPPRQAAPEIEALRRYADSARDRMRSAAASAFPQLAARAAPRTQTTAGDAGAPIRTGSLR